VELYHSKHSKDAILQIEKIVKEFDLLVTGGTDFHGEMADNGNEIGSVDVPYSTVLELKKYKNSVDKRNIHILK